MKIYFDLAWHQKSGSIQKSFKSQPAWELFQDYTGRISKYTACGIEGFLLEKFTRKPGQKIWICDRGEKKGKERGSFSVPFFSSEDIARAYEKLLNSGAHELHIMIGGPDGFSEKEIKQLNPDLCWSFGPLTLPHELAAIVAAEQIYRALTILNHHPYHSGH